MSGDVDGVETVALYRCIPEVPTMLLGGGDDEGGW